MISGDLQRKILRRNDWRRRFQRRRYWRRQDRELVRVRGSKHDVDDDFREEAVRVPLVLRRSCAVLFCFFFNVM